MGFAKIAIHEPIFKKKRAIKNNSLAGSYDWYRSTRTEKTRPPRQRADRYEKALKRAEIVYWKEDSGGYATFAWEDVVRQPGVAI